LLATKNKVNAETSALSTTALFQSCNCINILPGEYKIPS